MIRVVDQWLPDFSVDQLGKLLTNSFFPWHYCDKIVSACPTDNYQFTNVGYGSGEPKSELYGILSNLSVLEKLKASALIKIKANLQPRSAELIKNPLHVDNQFPNAMTAIYYVNTNNGYTFFENGETVDSIAGRLVIFPSSLKHGGTTCTDEKYRCVINFNYYPDS